MLKELKKQNSDTVTTDEVSGKRYFQQIKRNKNLVTIYTQINTYNWLADKNSEYYLQKKKWKDSI